MSWRIKNNHYYGIGSERTRYSPKICKKIKKPWTAIYIGPDYHDAKEVGRFKTWQEALDYVKSGGTPFALRER